MPVPDAKVHLRIGGVLTDVTDDVRVDEGIRLERGRSGEGAQLSPARAALKIENSDGKYSNRNPLSPYFGQLGRNTEMRVSVAGPVHLATTGTTATGTGATTPDAAALDIVGDIDIRFDATLDNWLASGSVELCGKGNATGNQRSWLLLMRDSRLLFEWSTTGADTIGATSTVDLPVPGSGRVAVRVVLDVNNGAGGNTTTFYTAGSLAGTWTQLGDPVVTAGVTSIFNSTASVCVGDGRPGLAFPSSSGQVHAFELRNSAGTVVANPDFSAQAAGATSFADGTGKVWTVGINTSITDRHYRSVVEVPEWAPRWHVSGHNVTSPLTGSGILRRLGQGRKPLDSTLRRRIPSFSPLQYWPMEDEDGATRAASALTGGGPLYTLGMTFGSDDSLPGSKGLPVIATGSRLNGRVPAPAAGVTEWQVEFVYFLPSAPGAATTLLGYWSTGTACKWSMQLQSGVATIYSEDAQGAIVVNQTVAIGSDLFGRWNRWQFYASQNGGNVDWQVIWINVGGGGGAFSGSYAGTVGRITDIVGPPAAYAAGADGLRLGHIAVFGDSAVQAFNSADHGFSGETPVERLRRLAEEESLPLVIAAEDGEQDLMGPQRPGTVLDLLAEAGETDQGMLYEHRNSVALAFRDRRTLYSQEPALTVEYAKLGPPFEPTDDDQHLRNDVTVNRIDGSSARVTVEAGPLSTLDPEDGGVGVYNESVSVSLYQDSQTEQQAAWRVHRGTWDEARYPRVRIMLHKYPELIPAVTALVEGDIIRITDTPSFLPPGPFDLMVEGIEEDIKERSWDVTFRCSPAGPWTVGIVEDDVLGRPDTDGSELASGVDADDLSFSVAVTAGPLWITSAVFPTHFPLDVMIGGERVSVSAISGGASPQTFTISARSVNGIVKAHSAGAPLSLADPMRPPL